mgnify:CR=1 FL=1
MNMTESMVRNSIYPVMDFATQFPEYTPKGLYNDELEKINNIQDFNLLMITKKDKVFEKDNHRLVVDTNGNCYWWPEWLRLANSSGIINSIASNYSRDYASANELYRVLAKSTISLLDKLKNHGNEEINLVTIFNNLRKQLIEQHYEKLTPSRFQVISSPDWTFRMIISDNPRIDLQEIVIPKQSVTSDVHPYPTEWLIQSFAEMDISPDIVGPGDKVPRLLDVFQSGDYERTLDSINGEQRIVTDMLKQIGIPPTIVDNIPNKRRPNILLRSLGFEPARGEYFRFFIKESLDKKLQPKQMFETLEMRCIEVYNAWINSFKEVLGTKSSEAYFELLNEGVSDPFTPSTLSLGPVLKFMRIHRGQLRRNSKYSEILSKKLPDRFLLVSKEAEEMLEILNVQRNLLSHTLSSMEKEQIDRIVNTLKPYNYFTLIKHGARTLPLTFVGDVSWEVIENRIQMTFTVSIDNYIEVETQNFSYAIFDPTYYIEMYHFENETVAFSGDAPEGCKASIIPPNPSNEAIALSRSSSLDAKPDSSIGRLFAETVIVNC